jgi:hypothetical protein
MDVRAFETYSDENGVKLYPLLLRKENFLKNIPIECTEHIMSL